jgi:predicted nuclease of predicted toxin-antitoxin system
VRFLTDQDVYLTTINFLRLTGHDVITASNLGMSQSSDAELLVRAASESRIFVTRDKDFGGLVFVQSMGKGVIFLRVAPATVEPVHQELTRVLQLYSEAELAAAFVVVEPGRHRFRKLN